jgi:hypothetical protein
VPALIHTTRTIRLGLHVEWAQRDDGAWFVRARRRGKFTAWERRVFNPAEYEPLAPTNRYGRLPKS